MRLTPILMIACLLASSAAAAPRRTPSAAVPRNLPNAKDIECLIDQGERAGFDPEARNASLDDLVRGALEQCRARDRDWWSCHVVSDYYCMMFEDEALRPFIRTVITEARKSPPAQ